MGERTSYLPGTPSWVDLGTSDIDAAIAFYRDILGWELRMEPTEEAGFYGMFAHDGKYTAGIGPQQSPGPPYWTVYMSVADVDATAASVTKHGGTVILPPMDVFESGRMAVFQDPQGSFFSAWQPKEHIGAEWVNDVGGFCWSELATNDLTVSSEFYRRIFGWGLSEEREGEDAEIYTIDGKVTCGAHTAGEGEFPAWSVWFTVEDCDASAARVTELGGQVFMPPNDMGFGRGAVVADPQGAVFGIAALTEIDP